MASLWDRLTGWTRAQGVSPAEVRAESWALGDRHRGEVLAGAQHELAKAGVPARRAVLLRAVIRARKAAK